MPPRRPMRWATRARRNSAANIGAYSELRQFATSLSCGRNGEILYPTSVRSSPNNRPPRYRVESRRLYRTAVAGGGVWEGRLQRSAHRAELGGEGGIQTPEPLLAQ